MTSPIPAGDCRVIPTRIPRFWELLPPESGSPGKRGTTGPAAGSDFPVGFQGFSYGYKNLLRQGLSARFPGACLAFPGWSSHPIILQKVIYKPRSDFSIAIAITIAIENRSGKIDQRFSFRNRSAISGSKPDPVFHFEIDPRLKNGWGNKIQTEHKIGSRFSYENRSPLLRSKSIRDFLFEIGIQFSDQNRDRKCDQKPLWKNRLSIFVSIRILI